VESSVANAVHHVQISNIFQKNTHTFLRLVLSGMWELFQKSEQWNLVKLF
jgi:hypothetical protein